MRNKLRIIGGAWRSRVIEFPDTPELRPSPARVRETLFNWLQYDLMASRCLDLFAGSGALGFEAASRGAKTVVQIEKNTLACTHLRRNAEQLAAVQVQVVQTDVFRYLEGEAAVFEVVFLDPPFKQGWVVPCCQQLEVNGWLSPHAKIYLETESGLVLEGLPENWQRLRAKTAGDVAYQLFQRQGG